MSGTATGEVTEASMHLPERQREALELRELRGLSYEEIAASMGTSREVVAQLIAHARINLYDELHGTVLASVAPPECERALPLIAAREDGELDAASVDATWLDSHLDECERCGRGVEEMREARATYAGSAATTTRVTDASPAGAHPQRRRRALLAAALVALLLLAGVAAAFMRDEPSATPVDPAASAQGSDAAKSQRRAKSGGSGKARRARAGAKRKKTDSREGATEPAAGGAPAGETTTAAAAAPVAAATEGGAPSEPVSRSSRPSGKTAVEPTQRTSSRGAASKPKPVPTPSPTPAPVPAPTTTEAPPAEESSDEPPRRREPPGKPADRPPG